MGRRFVVISLSVLLLLSAGCGRHSRPIPAATMSKICADMFLADQWIYTHPDRRSQADTTLIYEAVFRRYGYTTEDYDRSLSYYLYRPEKYKKIMDGAQAHIRKRLDNANKELEWSERNQSSDRLKVED